jgi:integrase
MRLTVRSVEAMRPTADRREVPDELLRGLYLIIHPTGAKSWAVRYRHRGQTRKFTLGGYPAIDLKAARELGAKALRAVAEDRDPGQERVQARSSQPDSIESVSEQFIERHVRRLNRPKTIRETERALRLHVLPYWRGRSVNSIVRRDILDVLDRVVDSGAPIAANRTLAAVRKLFNWCVSRDILTVSPAQGVKPPSIENARDRVLSDDELRLVWLAADRKIGWPFGPIVRLLALTGQRRDEVGKMQWSELDLDKRLWTLPRERTKNNKPHEVPLSEAAVAVLKAIPQIGSNYIFTTNGEVPSTGYSVGKQRLDALLPADMPAWRLHDLRRTVASGMARLNINLPVIEKVLNHSSGSFAGIVGVYQRHSFADEKRNALEAWGNFVTALVNEKSDKVVSLRGR